MTMDKKKYDEVLAAFSISDDELQKISADFEAEMQAGLEGEDSTLRMLRSYVALPTGKEIGDFLALDFGGTNVRALHILLHGGGRYQLIKKAAKPLTEPGVYDYVSESATAEEMFDFLAELIDEAIESNRSTTYLLGHTFSFPSVQTDLYNAKLITWTKEFATQGVEGKVVNDLLKEALARRGARNVIPVAVINDTVATLLAAAYKKPNAYIGSIYATGQNTCYFEKFPDGSETPTVINMESGGFGKLTLTKYDAHIDETSEKPGAQHLEKMVSGRYLGEIYGHALADLLGKKEPFSFTSIDLSAIVSDAYLDRHEAAAILEEKTGEMFNALELNLLQNLAALIIARSARLVAATFAGIVRHRAQGAAIAEQHIAIDGSVYEKMPLVAENLKKALAALLGDDAEKIHIVLENTGSALGAALAAAMTVEG